MAQVPDPPPLPVGHVVRQVSEPKQSVPIEPFVNTPVDAKKLVEVELVVVELRPVKFWRVDDASDKKPPVKVERPETESEERVPTDVSDEAVTPAARVLPVNEPAGALPEIFPIKLPVAVDQKRFVVEAVPETKRLVVVAEVVVEFPPIVRPPTMVVEAFWKMFVPDQRLFVVVPKAREIRGVAPPDDCTG